MHIFIKILLYFHALKQNVELWRQKVLKLVINSDGSVKEAEEGKPLFHDRTIQDGVQGIGRNGRGRKGGKIKRVPLSLVGRESKTSSSSTEGFLPLLGRHMSVSNPARREKRT